MIRAAGAFVRALFFLLCVSCRAPVRVPVGNRAMGGGLGGAAQHRMATCVPGRDGWVNSLFIHECQW